MRKMSYDKRKEKIGKLNTLKLEYLNRTAESPVYWLLAIQSASKISHITEDSTEFLALWENASDDAAFLKMMGE